MDYLWYSPKQVDRNQGGQARPGDLGFSIYLDSDGEPQKVSNVTQKPEHGTLCEDIRLVGSAEKAVWIGRSLDGFNDAARALCTAKLLEPNMKAILKYMDTRPYALQKPLKVGRTLKLCGAK